MPSVRKMHCLQNNFDSCFHGIFLVTFNINAKSCNADLYGTQLILLGHQKEVLDKNVFVCSLFRS